MDPHQRADTIMSSAVGLAIAILLAARVLATVELAGALEGRLYFAAWFLEVGLWSLSTVLIFGALLRPQLGGGSRGMMIAAGAISLMLAPVGGGLL